jgi:glycosyltransferase involved in cell wall biosynthesis
VTGSRESPDDGGDSIELSVVIPAFNAAATIGDQLEALAAQSWAGGWEVVVANNGSTDETATIVERFAGADSRIRLIDAGAVAGASFARNSGVEAARGASIAFCDADDVVSDGWVRSIGESLREHAFVTGPQEYERLNPRWLWAVYGTRPAKQLQTFEGIFPFGPTANLGVRREAFQRVGGFDLAISPYEDLDVCLRFWLQGIELVFVPDAVVHYRYRQDLRLLWKQAVSYGTAAPAISRALAMAGREYPSRWTGAKRWVWLLRSLPTLRTPAGRARWIVVAGTSLGRVAGSVRRKWLLL